MSWVGHCAWPPTADSCPSRPRPCGTRSPTRPATSYWVVGSKVIRDAEPGLPGARHRSSITRSASGRSRCNDHTEVLEARAPGAADAAGQGPPARHGDGDAADDARGRRDDGARSIENPDGPYAILSAQPAAARAHQGAQRGVADAPGGARPAPVARDERRGRSGSRPAPRARRRSRELDRRRARRRGRASAAGSSASRPRCCWPRPACRVVLIEADRIGHGVTGHTTAKVSSQHGLIYAQLRSKHGADAARHVRRRPTRRRWSGSRRASQRDGIDCDFRRRPSYAYVTRTRRSEAEDEAQAAAEAGLPAVARRDDAAAVSPSRAPCASTIRPSSTPSKYLHALARARGCPRSTSTRTPRSTRRAACVRTPGGRIDAEHVVVATHFPFPDRSLAFARVAPAALLRDRLPDRRRPARGHVHQRRLPDPLGPRGPGRTARSC